MGDVMAIVVENGNGETSPNSACVLILANVL